MDGAKDIVRASLYERDFYAWTMEQARALKARDWEALDLANVIEEIETLGRSERRELRSRIRTILEHLIKLDHGKNREPARGWQVTVGNQRIELRTVLQDNPSLRPEAPGLVATEYLSAREAAMLSFETYEADRLAEYERMIPKACPYSIEDVLG